MERFSEILCPIVTGSHCNIEALTRLYFSSWIVVLCEGSKPKSHVLCASTALMRFQQKRMHNNFKSSSSIRNQRSAHNHVNFCLFALATSRSKSYTTFRSSMKSNNTNSYRTLKVLDSLTYYHMLQIITLNAQRILVFCVVLKVVQSKVM